MLRRLNIVVFAVLALLWPVAASAQDAPAADPNEARQLSWMAALDDIDGAVGVGTAGDVAVSVACIFASPACEAAKRVVQRAVRTYRRVAMRSWKARGVNLPDKCFTFSIDGSQLDRIYVAYNKAQPNLRKGGGYLLSAYDLLGYGFIPVDDIECQETARSEILRVRGLTVAGL